MSWDNNIYDNPENFQVSIVGEAEYIGGYEWDKIVVWKADATGDLYYGQASGCSCNSPGDDFDGLSSLVKATKHEILAVIGERRKEDVEYDYYDTDRRVRESDQLIEKVAAL